MKKNKSQEQRQYRSNQGRSPRQIKSSYFGCGVSLIGLLIVFIIMLFTNLS